MTEHAKCEDTQSTATQEHVVRAHSSASAVERRAALSVRGKCKHLFLSLRTEARSASVLHSNLFMCETHQQFLQLTFVFRKRD